MLACVPTCHSTRGTYHHAHQCLSVHPLRTIFSIEGVLPLQRHKLMVVSAVEECIADIKLIERFLNIFDRELGQRLHSKINGLSAWMMSAVMG